MSPGMGRSAVMEHLGIPLEDNGVGTELFSKIGKKEYQTELPDHNDM